MQNIARGRIKSLLILAFSVLKKNIYKKTYIAFSSSNSVLPAYSGQCHARLTPASDQWALHHYFCFLPGEEAKQICVFPARKTRVELSCKASPHFLWCSMKILFLKFPRSNIFKNVSSRVYTEMGIRHKMTKVQVCKGFR